MNQNHTSLRSILGRPVDPRYPTNRAVMILSGVAAVVAGAVAGWRGMGLLAVAKSAFGGAVSGFVAWALARELAPDDNPAAFVSMALAFAGFLLIASPSSMLVVLGLVLARMVNRCVGMPARIGDSVAVTALAGWMVYSTRSPLPGVATAAAFALDARLPGGLARQWIFVVVCLVGAALFFLVQGTPAEPALLPSVPLRALLLLVSLAFGSVIWLTRRVIAIADATGDPLNVARVRAGMLVVLLLAIESFLPAAPTFAQATLLWATLAGVTFSAVVTRLIRKKSPAPTNPPPAPAL